MIKKLLMLAITGGSIISNVMAQDLKVSAVPVVVKSALTKKYPAASKVSWEKEKGNYEANWGGKSGEDNSAIFTPSGVFVEIINAIAIIDLPVKVFPYIKQHYKGAKILEAGKVTDARNNQTYEVEIKGMDLIFDTKGNFIKQD